MTVNKELYWLNASVAALVIAVATVALTSRTAAQDLDEDDPSGRVARLAYMQGSVSLEPAGESEWVEAVSNRPMTIGDRLWTDRGSRAEVQLGSAAIRLDSNTDFSFLNLDDRTTQIQLAAGALDIRVRWLDRDEIFEVDTPNQAFWVTEPGRYRVEASEDGTYTVVSVREGEGESTGNGQNYALHAGQRWTFSGTDQLTADAAQIGDPDEFDNWAYGRERRFDDSRSAQYVSRDVVGYDDLDDYGEWRDDSQYGHVWFPQQVGAGWAPYRAGHWDWIVPWGWTWVDDAPWGYAPFHYGRWVFVGQRWGWVAGPPSVRSVYAPALVVFLGSGGGFGENVGWFPLAPHEVYVPWYRVSRGYVSRVNESNTTVSTTTITNIYNTTIVNKTTNITNVTYKNRNVQGAVTAVPQRTFVSAQPVARAAVAVNAQQIGSAPLSAKVSLAPTRESVLGARANTANRVTAPPPAVRNRQVVAKTAPPPPPVPFARQQQAMAQHPGEPPSRREVQNTRPAAIAGAHPAVRMAPPAKPATPNAGRPASQSNPLSNQHAPEAGQPTNTAPATEPSAAKPGQPTTTPPEEPTNRPRTRPTPSERRDVTPPPQPNRQPSAQPTRPEPTPDNQPEPRRAEPNRPQPTNPPEPRRVEPNRPEPSHPTEPSKQSDRVPAAPDNRPEPNRPPSNQPDNRPERARPDEPPARSDRPASGQPNRPAPNERLESPGSKPNSPSQAPKPGERNNPPASETNPSRPPQAREPQTPEERKQEQERRKKEQQQKRQQQKEQQQKEQQQKEQQQKEQQQKPPEQ